MILDSAEVEKQRENETTKGVHVRFEPGTVKSLQKLSFSHLECDENGNKKNEFRLRLGLQV